MLQEAGTVLHLARSGRLIIKASTQLTDYTVLIDENGRRACRIMEMIGPVASPYFSAQPFTDRIERILGTKLYVSEDKIHDKPGSDTAKFERSNTRRNFRRK